jgi:hypothetical protein
MLTLVADGVQIAVAVDGGAFDAGSETARRCQDAAYIWIVTHWIALAERIVSLFAPPGVDG